MATSIDPLWMRVSVAGKVHKPQALLDVLHNVFLLPKKRTDVFNLLIKFKNNMQKKLGGKIKDYQWDLLCHDCNQQAIPCPTPCPKQGDTDLNALDITNHAIIFRNIEHIIPKATQQKLSKPISQLKAPYKPFVEKACDDRNFLMHFPPRNMSQQEFDDAWIAIEQFLKDMKYARMQDFKDMKTCLLDAYYKQQLELMKDRCNDFQLQITNLETKKGDDVDVKSNKQDIVKLKSALSSAGQ